MIIQRLLLAIMAVGCFGLGLTSADDSDRSRPPSAHSCLSGVLSLTVDSSHLKPGGRIVGGVTAMQRLVMTRTNNLASGDHLQGMALMGMDLDSREPGDGAFGIEYGNATAIPGRIVRGYSRPHFRDRVSAGYQYWKLREEIGATASHYVYGRWDHFSRADWALTAMYGFPRDGRQPAALVEFRMTDSWAIPGVGDATRLIPLVGVAYGVNWFSAVHDGTVMAFGIGVRREIHRRVRLGLNLEGQRRLSGDETRILNKAWVSLVADILF